MTKEELKKKAEEYAEGHQCFYLSTDTKHIVSSKEEIVHAYRVGFNAGFTYGYDQGKADCLIEGKKADDCIRCANDFIKVCNEKKELETKIEKTRQITLNEIAKTSYETARKRQENGANISVETGAMLKHFATEVVEVMEAYTNLDNSIVYDSDYKSYCKKRFASELADIICCAAIIAHAEEIDLNKAVADCLEKKQAKSRRQGRQKN